MSYFFDNNNRYQIIYPFTSEKINVASNISDGAQKCYQEIKENNIMTHVFIVHEIDQGNMYYFDIPKYKNLIPVNNNDQSNLFGLHEHIPNRHINQSINIIPIKSISNTNQPQYQPQSTNQLVEQKQDYDQAFAHRVITRLNNVEFELDAIKRSMALNNQKVEKDEELSCSVM